MHLGCLHSLSCWTERPVKVHLPLLWKAEVCTSPYDFLLEVRRIGMNAVCLEAIELEIMNAGSNDVLCTQSRLTGAVHLS